MIEKFYTINCYGQIRAKFICPKFNKKVQAITRKKSYSESDLIDLAQLTNVTFNRVANPEGFAYTIEPNTE
ncbi:hypothetical protein COB55_05810 [Candidatus Wolfebacteria bacterium]|nr:MAG: hypothetical protein COB55_05810 [Candidatus Wolfebacteria bacterium]